MLTPAEIVKATQVISDVPVHVLVPRLGPVSFYSQQKRAYNLVSALRLEDKLPPGTTVGVVGAGLAGVTAAAAAHMLRCDVTLFESNEARFHQQHGNHTRYIHPNVVEWPRRRWDESETDMPFLNWSAGDCAMVIEDIEDQWKAFPIEFKKSHFVRVSKFRRNSASITGSSPFYHREFKIVLITAGFGAENTFGLSQRSYWSDEHWHQLLSTDGKSFFVSGTGDGGLIDATRLALLKFDQGEVLKRVMTSSSLLDIAEDLISADAEARSICTASPTPETRANASEFLYNRYNELKVQTRLPALQVRENFKRIVLNSTLPTALDINASIVNRVIVHGLVADGVIEYESGELCGFPRNKFPGHLKLRESSRDVISGEDDDRTVKDIDEIIIRHGAAGALVPILGRKAKKLLAHSDQVDQLGREEHWREIEFQTPVRFKPSNRIAQRRGVRHLEEFEAFLRRIDVKPWSIKVAVGSDELAEWSVEVDLENRTKLLKANRKAFHRLSIVPAKISSWDNRQGVMLPTERLRPLTLGAGITSYKAPNEYEAVGAVSCFAKASDGKIVLVTAGPVLKYNRLYQPSTRDAETKDEGDQTEDPNLIATVKKTHRTKRLGNNSRNTLEVGYAILAPTVEYIPSFSPAHQLPIPRRLAPADYELLQKEVWIIGFGSPLKGVVDAVKMTDVKVGLEEGLFEVAVRDPVHLGELILGAVVMTLDGTMLGLVCGGDDGGATYKDRVLVYPLGPALTQLECKAIFLTRDEDGQP
ncbi:NAD(P)-binding protein [Bradyrhizobium sp. 174]|uniref:NAD(P)-binding protein n=1 Tax=Bradyrhizobium sp. 174 TaxID=2782645 RepID=UPI001FFA89A0|nr:NAD(P)-binding protein [Bradyrhizobium sp. 174]MCK1574135.1 hypothetical protein [Bradyrhizobium sp. 174]